MLISLRLVNIALANGFWFLFLGCCLVARQKYRERGGEMSIIISLS